MMNLRSASFWSFALLAAAVIALASGLSWWLAGLDAMADTGSGPVQVIDQPVVFVKSQVKQAVELTARPNSTQDFSPSLPSLAGSVSLALSPGEKMQRLRMSQSGGEAPQQTATAINLAAPGNSMVQGNQVIGIEHQVTDLGLNGNSSVDLVFASFDPNVNADIVTGSEAPELAANNNSQTEQGQSAVRPLRRGFTEEEELFRAHWGWASYDASLRVAQQIAQEGITTTSSSQAR